MFLFGEITAFCGYKLSPQKHPTKIVAYDVMQAVVNTTAFYTIFRKSVDNSTPDDYNIK